MDEEASSKKRPARETNGVMNGHAHPKSPPVKRTRLSKVENFVPTSENKFLMLHLQILRAVYDDCDKQQQPKEDDIVKEECWNTIDKFLRERDDIRSMSDAVETCRGIHEEAVRFMEEERQEPSNNNHKNGWMIHPDNPPTPAASLFSSSLLKSTQPSPRAPKFSATSFSLLSANIDEEENEQSQEESFRFIAVFLKQKYDQSNQRLCKKTDPYRELLQAVRQRVAVLEGLLIGPSSRPSALSNNPKPRSQKNGIHTKMTNGHRQQQQQQQQQQQLGLQDLVSHLSKDKSEVVMARLSTKLRLWRLLLNDLAKSTT